MIMMFYIVSFLSRSDTVAAMLGGDTMQGILSLGSGVIFIFALIFLFYTNSFLIRRRKKEFGLYNILGMGKRNLAGILVWESVIIAALSYLGGLFCGILFSKLAELVMTRLLHGSVSLGFSVDWSAILRTLGLFAIIHCLILLNALRQIHVSNPVELLRSEAVGEKPPKSNWLLALLGVLILGGAYYLALTIEDPVAALVTFFLAVVMVIVATYLLFIAGSVVLCRLLQKSKRYYYKTNHFVSVSSMVYRMKRNGAGLASICILSTMVLVMISSTMCLYIGTEDTLRAQYPRNIIVETDSLDTAYIDAVHGAVEEVLEKSGQKAENLLYYRYLDAAVYLAEDRILFEEPASEDFQLSLYENVWQLFVLSLEDYNRLMGQKETLQEDEVLLYTTKSTFSWDTITIGTLPPRRVEKISEFIDSGMGVTPSVPALYLIVSDFDALGAMWEELVKPENGLAVRHDYYGFDLDCDAQTQIEIGDTIYESLLLLQQTDDAFPQVSAECAEKDRANLYALYGSLFFLGALLGAVFLCAAVLIMYYKQITEGYEDQSRFEIMQKVGMSKPEIRKSINSQVLTVFFLPLAAAGIHLLFAFPMISKMLSLFSLTNTALFTAVIIGCYLVFALFYIGVYFLTSREYFSIVSGGKRNH